MRAVLLVAALALVAVPSLSAQQFVALDTEPAAEVPTAAATVASEVVPAPELANTPSVVAPQSEVLTQPVDVHHPDDRARLLHARRRGGRGDRGDSAHHLIRAAPADRRILPLRTTRCALPGGTRHRIPSRSHPSRPAPLGHILAGGGALRAAAVHHPFLPPPRLS
jgi:hypothetical protein